MGQLKEISKLYLEIVIWVCVWGIITYLMTKFIVNAEYKAALYITITIVATLILFYGFKDEPANDCKNLGMI